MKRFFAGASFVRHPVSVARERAGVVTLAFLVACFAIYVYSTRDAAIQQRAVDFIRKSTPGGVEIAVGGARFAMFEGITLYNVSIAVPFDERMDPAAKDFASRTIFSTRSLKLVHNPWLLLFGRLRVERVVAVQPTIYLRHNTDTGMHNWQLLATTGPKETEKKVRFRPDITLRMARAVLISLDGSGGRESRTEELDADVRPHPQADTGYYIEVRRYSDPIERTTVFFDPGEKMVANTPFVDAQTVRLQLPRGARNLFDMIALSGEVRLTRMLYDASDEYSRDTEILLRRVQCDVPLRLLERSSATTQPSDAPQANDDSRDESLVRMNDVRGSVKLIGDRIIVNADGLINRAPCRVQGELVERDGGLKNFGVDVTFEASGLPVPEGAVRSRMLEESTDLPRAVREFLVDYDPHGRLDAFFHFTRAPNAAGNLRTDGFIKTLQMRGRTIWFPYPMDDVTGFVRFAGKDVTIENLNGRHGSGRANINAKINVSRRYSSVDLDIKATSIPIDTHLHEALPERYKAVLDKFCPRGMAHVHARLQRPGGPEDQPRPKWKQTFSIDLVDARATILPHPHPLENIHGRLEVDGDRIRVIGLCGESDGASMRFDGYAMIRAARDREMEMRFEARGIRMDDAYVAGMPPNLRNTLSDFQPRGTLDLLGTLSLRAGDEDIRWELGADVRDASIRYARFPYQLDHVEGELELSENRLKIVNATAAHGDAAIAVSGDINRNPDRTGATVNLTFDARGVPLDHALYESLPEGLRKVWRILSPKGRIRVRTALHGVDSANRKFLGHRTELEPVDADILFDGFPLPLSHVNGRVIALGDHVEIVEMRGRAGGGEVVIAGEIDLTPPGRRGVLTIRGDHLHFDPATVSAMPAALRKFVQSVSATGGFHLRLKPLAFETDAEGKTRWRFNGTLGLEDAAADLGFKIQQCSGTVKGAGEIDPDGAVTLNADVALGRLLMAGWNIDALNCRIRTDDAGRRILVEDAVARLYGGEGAGFAEIELGKRRSEYQASITAVDMQLDTYLAAHRTESQAAGRAEDGSTARGNVSGNLILRGRTGRTGYLEGAGEFYIRQAQVWKLPLLLGVFQVLNLTPDENVFHDGMMKFFLTRDQLILNKIDLQGRAVSFIGGGTLDLNTNLLDITLLTGSSLRINVPLLTDILEGASREIMEVHVTGTLSEPRIVPEPLKSITAALKTLFPEPPRSQNRKPRPTPLPSR